MAIDQEDCTAYTAMVDMVATVGVTLWFVLMSLEIRLEEYIRLPRGVISTN